MNILIDKLSTILKNRVGDIDFNTNFRIGMLFEMLMQDRNIPKEIKVIQAIKLYYPHPEQITDIEKAYDDIIWFYTCGKSDFNNNKKDEEEKTTKKKISQQKMKEFMTTNMMMVIFIVLSFNSMEWIYKKLNICIGGSLNQCLMV